MTVVRDVRVRRWIFAPHLCHVLQPHHVARWRGEHYHLLDVANTGLRAVHIDGLLARLFADAPRRGRKAFREERHGQRPVTQAVACQPVVVEDDAHLVLLHTRHGHAPHALHRAQTVFQLIHIVRQLAVGLVVALHRDKQGRRVAEVVHHHHGHDPSRQLSLELVHAVLEFRPELLLVLYLVVQLHLHHAHAAHRRRGSLLLAHILVREDVVL